MNRRQRKKVMRAQELERKMDEMVSTVEGSCSELQNSMIRLNYLVKEHSGLISRFPAKVEDWKTNPPIHTGRYIVYFVRKDGVKVRLYNLVGGKWYDGMTNELNITALNPACYLMVPVLTEDAIEIYRRSR